MKQTLTERDKRIRSLISNTIRQAEPSAQIILYGSRARGDARQNSDWDVLVIVNQAQTGLSDYTRLCYPIYCKGLDCGEEINATLYTQKEWNDAPPSIFKQHVLEEGVAL